ncbi:ABC transporter domain-containing protein [Psidium guajava]|nr:ABC transporter domain-containing protein [Psidium guajava]
MKLLFIIFNLQVPRQEDDARDVVLAGEEVGPLEEEVRDDGTGRGGVGLEPLGEEEEVEAVDAGSEVPLQRAGRRGRLRGRQDERLERGGGRRRRRGEEGVQQVEVVGADEDGD